MKTATAARSLAITSARTLRAADVFLGATAAAARDEAADEAFGLAAPRRTQLYVPTEEEAF